MKRWRILSGAAVVSTILLMPTVGGAEPGFGAAASLPTIPAYSYQDFTCTAPDTCVATLHQGLQLDHFDIASEVDGTWGAPQTIEVAGDAVLTQYALSCPAAGACVAVGELVPSCSCKVEPWAMFESGGVWGVPAAVPTPDIGADDAYLNAVDCTSPGDCIALGAWQATGTSPNTPFVIESSNGVWGTPVTLPLLADYSVGQTAISCVDLQDCTVLGWYSVPGGGPIGSYVQSETTGTWHSPQMLLHSPFLDDEMYGLACPTALACVVVGEDVRVGGNVRQPAVVTEVDGHWGHVIPLSPPLLTPDLETGWLDSVSCLPDGQCTAVGDMSKTTTSPAIPAAVTIDRGTPGAIGIETAQKLGGPSPSDAALNGIWCFTDLSCEAIGEWSADALRGAFEMPIIPTRATAAPLAPLDVRARAVGRAVVVTWQPPRDDGGAPVLGFRARLGGHLCATRQLHCVFRALAAPRHYVATITDENRDGSSTVTRSNVVFVPATRG